MRLRGPLHESKERIAKREALEAQRKAAQQQAAARKAERDSLVRDISTAIPAGPAGETGPQGATGPRGPQGPEGEPAPRVARYTPVYDAKGRMVGAEVVYSDGSVRHATIAVAANGKPGEVVIT